MSNFRSLCYNAKDIEMESIWNGLGKGEEKRNKRDSNLEINIRLLALSTLHTGWPGKSETIKWRQIKWLKVQNMARQDSFRLCHPSESAWLKALLVNKPWFYLYIKKFRPVKEFVSLPSGSTLTSTGKVFYKNRSNWKAAPLHSRPPKKQDVGVF